MLAAHARVRALKAAVAAAAVEGPLLLLHCQITRARCMRNLRLRTRLPQRSVSG